MKEKSIKEALLATVWQLLALLVVLTTLLGGCLAITPGGRFILAILWIGMTERDHLSDEALIENLEKDLAKYEQLIAMYREDSPATVIHPDWMQPNNVISDGRWNEYKKLFRELKLDGGMRSSGNSESIRFTSTPKGFVFGGSSKGYVYKPEDPQPLYPTLNSIPEDQQSNFGEGYRKINNEWYIYYSWH